ncbi:MULTISPECIES: DNA alkylation repair protein [unclassified Fusibacter]|uniref:DNA alkylation repair protein n=1 Tax=unclassified Fusibacter TaxID=2624464 RepID=UPI001013365C|nr:MULTISPECIES: DNA alkylation repair protein [unclassified Fusibacter]MCK8061143.1 hypothetical protein [Fusibacter sp. A2]NPE23321.1 DNA alkylation repair protein [Fusibacter sp. A1]RXV59363.1 DNA alkylation repair protein [Fusibacter sp. A1]
MPEPSFSLKDQLFNQETVSMLANAIASVDVNFDSQSLINEALSAFPQLELKERMALISDLIDKHINKDYATTLQILEKSLDFVPDETEVFVFGAYQDYIMKRGCTSEHLDLSLDYMGKFTVYFSAEFALRAFINAFPEETLKAVMQWAKSENYHRRRLASEGLRPKLPWAIGINFDYQRAIEVLDLLFSDSERYVTRSVANHMNDIAKIDANLVISTLRRWQETHQQEPAEMTYITNHALRTLIKRGNSKALELLGYPTNPDIVIGEMKIKKDELKLNDFLEFEFTIKANESLSLMIDYTVDYPMANGKRSEKVFKIKKASLKKDESIRVTKKHQFKLMTTKKLYSGQYQISLKVNGSHYKLGAFSLTI